LISIRRITYADIDPETGQFIGSDYIVGRDNPTELGLKTHLRETSEIANKTRLEKAVGAQNSQWLNRRRRSKGLGGFIPLSSHERASGISTGRIVGSIVGLCIPVDFEDEPAKFDQSDIRDFCNRPRYSRFNNAGSVRDYFLDVSLGRFDYSNLVTPVYRAKHKKDYYTNPRISGKKRTAELIDEALSHLMNTGFDFSSVSIDEDNAVYALNIFNAGKVENNFNEGLWPHQWSLRNQIDIGVGSIIDYQITNMGDKLVIGTFCHETGHLICRFPDLYDTSFKSAGAGIYCLMGLGGIADERNPAHPCAYLKFEAGWDGPIQGLTDSSVVTLKPNNNSMAFFMRNNHEYYVIEHRTAKARDAVLPSTGLAIWHIDTRQDNNNDPSSNPNSHYLCALLQADGEFDLERNVNDGDKRDLFGQNQYTEFPNDDTGMAADWWDGSPAKLTLKRIKSTKTGTRFEVSIGNDLGV